MVELHGDPLAIWEQWCDRRDRAPVDSGHHIAEENPGALAAALTSASSITRLRRVSSLPPEDNKLVVLARATRARTGAAEGAALRDLDGRTYAGATVDLPSPPGLRARRGDRDGGRQRREGSSRRPWCSPRRK